MRWIEYSKLNKTLMKEALIGGYDINGSPIYVGRAQYLNNVIPGKVYLPNKTIYITYDGKEIALSKFDVLFVRAYDWILSRDGNIPDNAVAGGVLKSKEILYIGRQWIDDKCLIPGKIIGSQKALFISFRGVERIFDRYEVLVIADNVPKRCIRRPKPYPDRVLSLATCNDQHDLQWVPSSIVQFPPYGSVIGGCDFDGNLIFVGRVERQSSYNLVIAIPHKNDAFTIAEDGKEIRVENYELLCDTKCHWTTAPFSHIPSNAIIGGETIDKKPWYIGRVWIKRYAIPGVIIPPYNCMEIIHSGVRKKSKNFDVLVFNKCHVTEAEA